MRPKLIEIRDRATFIPALAIKLDSETEAERYLLSRAGYGQYSLDHQQYVLLSKVDGGEGKITCDPYAWGNNNTMSEAHVWIEKHFDEIESGDVVDVEFIMGRSAAPKQPERATVQQ